jgi:ORF6N domain
VTDAHSPNGSIGQIAATCRYWTSGNGCRKPAGRCVETRALNQAVRRSAERFPEDFRFQLTPAEAGASRSQFVISNSRRYAPYAFTEHGAIMAATVLNSPRAVEMSV